MPNTARPLATSSRARPSAASAGKRRARSSSSEAPPARAGEQEPLPLPPPQSREERRQSRVRRPHLRERTLPGADSRERIHPLRRPDSESLLTPEVAESMEAALNVALSAPEGGRRHRAAESTLLHLLTPFLEGEVEHACRHHERTYLEREDLLQEALLRAQKLWRGFTPGRAGPGRTLYPAYVKKAVRQHLGNVLEDARLMGPTQWGRKLAARARRRAPSGKLYEEALRQEGADDATVLGLTIPSYRTSEAAAIELPDRSSEAMERLQLQAEASAALARLPRRERMAITVPLGFARRQLSDAKLARRLRCAPEDLLAARARGLASLREAMEGSEHAHHHG